MLPESAQKSAGGIGMPRAMPMINFPGFPAHAHAHQPSALSNLFGAGPGNTTNMYGGTLIAPSYSTALTHQQMHQGCCLCGSGSGSGNGSAYPPGLGQEQGHGQGQGKIIAPPAPPPPPPVLDQPGDKYIISPASRPVIPPGRDAISLGCVKQV